MSKVGRNDPCPCGSGEKYKRCCLDEVVALRSAEQRALELQKLDERPVFEHIHTHHH